MLDSDGLIPVELVPDDFRQFLSNFNAIYLSPHAEEELLEVVRLDIVTPIRVLTIHLSFHLNLPIKPTVPPNFRLQSKEHLVLIAGHN